MNSLNESGTNLHVWRLIYDLIFIHSVVLLRDQIGRFIGFQATFQSLWQQLIYQKSLTFLGNFCKGVKIFNFSSEIIFGQLLQKFGDYLLVTLIPPLSLARKNILCSHPIAVDHFFKILFSKPFLLKKSKSNDQTCLPFDQCSQSIGNGT